MLLTRRLIHSKTIIEEPDGYQYNKDGLLSLANRFHTMFDERGLQAGDVIAINDFQTIEHFALMITAFERGVIIVTIPRMDLLQEDRSRFDYVDMNVKYVFEGLWADFESEWDVPIIYMEEVHGTPECINIKYCINADSPAMMSQTSGSTGKPKKFYHSHKGIWQAIKTSSQMYYKEGDNILLYSSLNHMGVITMQILPALMVGAKIHTHWAFDGELLFEQMQAKKPNKMILFPQNTKVMQELEGWDQLDLSHLEEVISGGGSLPIKFCKELFDKGVKIIHNVYGLSEALPPMFTQPLTKDTTEIDMWSPVFGVNMGELVSDWEIKIKDGLLWVKGTTAAFGLDIDAQKDEEGFICTGDEVTEMYNGAQFWIKGRGDKVVRRNDVLISLRAIRNALMYHNVANDIVVHYINDKIVAGLIGRAYHMPSVDSLNVLLRYQLGQAYSIDYVVEAKASSEADQIKEITKLIS